MNRAVSPAPLTALFDHLWRDYVAITPLALRVFDLLTQRGETVANDHIAFRTFNRGPIALEELAKPFLALGYRPTGEYRFEEKKLFARSYSHADRNQPRVFISELLVDELPAAVQALIDAFIAKIDPSVSPEDWLWSRAQWPKIRFAEYQALLQASEYAGWLAAFGIRANHFTVAVNRLTSFANLATLNDFLEGAGLRLNGGDNKIQGSPAVLLEQSSTLAQPVTWQFADQAQAIPSCYYEFALRYIDPATGELYDGFVAKSADKIFESTDVRHHLA